MKSHEVPLIDTPMCKTNPHRRHFLVVVRITPVVVESLNQGDLCHHLGLVEVLFVPDVAGVSGGNRRPRGKEHVAPKLVKVGIYAA